MNARTLTVAVLTFSMGAMLASPSRAEEKAEAKEDTYPLKTCVVSGDKLDAMGEPIVYSYEGREIRFCCKECIQDFEKKPEKYLAKLDQALKAQADGEEGDEGHAHAAHETSESATGHDTGAKDDSGNGHQGHSH